MLTSDEIIIEILRGNRAVDAALQKQQLLTLEKYELAYTGSLAELGIDLLQAVIKACT